LPEATAFIEESKDNYAVLQQAWREELRPEGVEQEWLFEMIVADTVRVERCQQSFFAQCAQHARHASERWDADRRIDAEALASGLAKTPALVAARLQATPQGCDLMIRRWKGLRSSLDRHQTWTDNQRSHALDLLGIHPDFRDAETPVDPVDGDLFAIRCDLVDSEIRRLATVRESTIGLDDTERALAEQSLGAEFTKPVQLLDRYERNAFRRQQWARRQLSAAQRGDAPETAKPVPVSAAPPAPRAIPPAPQPALVASPTEPVASPRLAHTPDQRTPRATNLNRRQRRAQAAMQRRA
jgi:hypothetical protein